MVAKRNPKKPKKAKKPKKPKPVREKIGFYSSARQKNKPVSSGLRKKTARVIMKPGKSNQYINIFQWRKYGKKAVGDKSEYEKKQQKKAERKAKSEEIYQKHMAMLREKKKAKPKPKPLKLGRKSKAMSLGEKNRRDAENQFKRQQKAQEKKQKAWKKKAFGKKTNALWHKHMARGRTKKQKYDQFIKDNPEYKGKVKFNPDKDDERLFTFKR